MTPWDPLRKRLLDLILFLTKKVGIPRVIDNVVSNFGDFWINFLGEYEAMQVNQGPGMYFFMKKKNEGQKSCDIIPFSGIISIDSGGGGDNWSNGVPSNV
jgi:hypothetical protein